MSSPFTFDNANLKELSISISDSRLSTYSRLTANDSVEDSLMLYELNSQLTGAFWAPMQMCEVTLRNRLNDALMKSHGHDWLVSRRVSMVDWQRREVERAQMGQSGFKTFGLGIWYRIFGQRHEWKVIYPRPVGQVKMADFSFGFWVQFLGNHYDTSLWREHLSVLFADGHGPMSRKRVHRAYDEIRLFRNRMAHHEQIINKDPMSMLVKLIEVCQWLNPVTSEWIVANEKVTDTWADISRLKSKHGWTGF